ncbi:MAG TPA: glycoside hydrolase family 104 protein [Elusimicrobiales bacterium]|nr:glycoside hydrolase family 104 protein [Elusimicrobiales bacterium]
MKAHCGYLALAALLALPCGLMAGQSAWGDLAGQSGLDKFSPVPAPSAPAAPRQTEAVQYIPADNNEPGFNWPYQGKAELNYLQTGAQATYLKTSDAAPETLLDGVNKCSLSAKTLYNLRAAPVFEAQHIIADLETPLPGCAFTRGYIYMAHVSSTSAGGLWELPVNVRAFMDTIAFAEGTKEQYNYIYTFVTFKSYSDHPRKKICSGGLCSTAAGRYQFLTKTWDTLAGDLALTDFTPPSQDKAAVELVRRAGAYTLASKASTYANFTKAISKINTIWASLPGSPYGQPTHSLAKLWTVYQAALAGYK